MDSSENQRRQHLVKSPGYWKTCFKLKKSGEVAKIERARNAPFPQVHSKFEWGDVFFVKVHYGMLFQIFPLLIPAKTKGSRT